MTQPNEQKKKELSPPNKDGLFAVNPANKYQKEDDEATRHAKFMAEALNQGLLMEEYTGEQQGPGKKEFVEALKKELGA